jgi:hypothetical protein
MGKREEKERKMFDDMWDIPRLYASACSNSCQLVPLHPILMSILFHHYKELKECILEVKQLEGKVKGSSSSKNKEELMIKKEEAAPATTTLDVYFLFRTGRLLSRLCPINKDYLYLPLVPAL